MKRPLGPLNLATVLVLFVSSAKAQVPLLVSRLAELPAVSGYEKPLVEQIRSQLRDFSPQTDNLGNLWVSFGNGSPHRLLVTPVDEPGYLVSDITPEGFLRVQRLPQAAPNPVFDTLHFAQPVWVMTRSGKKVPGVFAGLSVHLQPARVNPPKMNHPDEMYVDIGATSAADVRAAGVDVLDPIAIQRRWIPVGSSGDVGPATGDRFGCTALLQLLERIKDSKAKGTTTVAFVTQQWTGGRGLNRLLEAYLQIPKPGSRRGEGAGGRDVTETSVLQVLVEAYGASGHEENVRKAVLSRLDARLQKRVETDPAGNLILHLGDEKREGKTPRIAFVAHMDEIGYEVKKIEDDGRLLVSVLGGGYQEYFLGHVALVHKADGTATGGALELPAGWDQPGFEWPHGPRSMDEPVQVYVGTHSAKETEQLGIKVGDWVTIPKEYRSLLGKRANARSFDDRVGCAALIEAVRALGPDLPGRDVTFIWSTEEEVGLKGAAAAAERMAKEGHAPDFVFAIDTFVSSDSMAKTKSGAWP